MKKGARKENIVKRNWHLFDAKNKILGRLATQIVHVLMGKNKPSFVPWQDRGDYVVVINAEKVKVSGRKEKQKLYFRHSGFLGSLKEETLEKLRQRRPEEIIRRAVKNMLPKNKLRRGRMRRLKIVVGDQHPYEDKIKNQKPKIKNTD